MAIVLDHRSTATSLTGNQCTIIKCTKACTWYLKCACSVWKIGFTICQIPEKIPWFFRIDFFKFHDFSTFLGSFSSSMIVPGLEKDFFSFSRFPWFYQRLETLQMPQCFSNCDCKPDCFIVNFHHRYSDTIWIFSTSLGSLGKQLLKCTLVDTTIISRTLKFNKTQGK